MDPFWCNRCCSVGNSYHGHCLCRSYWKTLLLSGTLIWKLYLETHLLLKFRYQSTQGNKVYFVPKFCSPNLVSFHCKHGVFLLCTKSEIARRWQTNHFNSKVVSRFTSYVCKPSAIWIPPTSFHVIRKSTWMITGLKLQKRGHMLIQDLLSDVHQKKHKHVKLHHLEAQNCGGGTV